MAQTDVLIVGAGPAGLTLASALLPTIPTTVISSRTSRELGHSRATGIQPRTLSILKAVGALDTVRREAITLQGNMIYLDGQRRYAVSFYDPQTKEYGLSLDQRRIEALLEQNLAQKQQNVRWQKTLTALNQDGPLVRAQIQDQNGSIEQIDCKYLIGCDGGRSTVRRSLDIAFPGETYPEACFALDALVSGDLEPGYMHFFVGKTNRLVLVPLNNNGLFKVSGALALEAAESIEDPLAMVLQQQGLERITITPRSPLQRYKLHARCADTFQSNNQVFLCGDAAHLFPPNGGQGMNVAIEDAFELANLLNQAALTRCSDGLAAYDSRRAIIAERLRAVVATKERYSYDQLMAGIDKEREEQRIRKEEL